MRRYAAGPLLALLFYGLLAACGGGSGSAPTPPAPTGIGPAGGTVTGPNGAKVVVPAGALSGNVNIAIAESSVGAPALPTGVTGAGSIYAFTPHGTAFAAPVTITVPFDPTRLAAGATPALYKTNAAQNTFEPVAGASVSGNAMSGQVSGFSYLTVATPLTATTAPIKKTWLFEAATSTGPYETIAGNTESTGLLLDAFRSVGRPLPVFPPTSSATVDTFMAYSNESGKTFYTSAIAPHTNPFDAKPYVAAISELTQVFTFEVQDEPPSLQFLVTRAHLETMDHGGNIASPVSCPWLPQIAPSLEQINSCEAQMTMAINILSFKADSARDNGTFFSVGGQAEVNGIHMAWKSYMQGYSDSWHSLWSDTDFDVNKDADGDGGRHVVANLKQSIPVVIPVSHLRKGDVFQVTTFARSIARNLIQGESFVGAYVRDPATTSGLGMSFTGLKLIPPRTDIPSGSPAVSCPGPNPSAGELKFSDAVVSAPEGGRSLLVTVERTGGTTGVVSAVLATTDGSALAGSDYQAVRLNVRFADGEAGQRVVEIPLVVDSIIEPDENLTASLSQPGGCASLGSPSSATLTILDDDTPVTAPQLYSVGGMVTGLAGSGLVLREVLGGSNVTPVNGPFTFPVTRLNGAGYEVRVESQPTNPIQQCTIANGQGSIAGANVTNVAVTCTTPPPPGSLDAVFGNGGRATSTVAYVPRIFDSRIGMALQADGKILMVGGLKLLRFNADGTPDATFGSAGVVDVVFNGGALDTAMDVAVQADGRIVVVGTTATNTVGSDDFALVRYNANGSIDTGFGTAGHVTSDFYASTDRARRLKIQADGRIIVVGSATQVFSASVASVTFATARYLADGSPDTSFGVAGRTNDSPFGSYSIARGVTIQADGKIVVAGSTANDGVTDPDSGFVRYLGPSASRDTGFGFAQNGVVHAPVGAYDEAVDVVTLDNGTVLGAIRINAGTTTGGRAFGFGLAHVPANGIPPPNAVTPLTTFTTESDVPTAMLKQADGKIVVVGQSASLGANPNMALVRYSASGLSQDGSFGTNGRLTVDFFGARDSAEAVVQQADGMLVVGGYARSGSSNVFALARIAP